MTIFVVHNYTTTSFANMSVCVAHELAQKGHEVVFISHLPRFEAAVGKEKEGSTVTVMSWPFQSRPTGIRNFIWFSKLYFKYRPSVVFAHFVGENISLTVGKLLSLGRTKTIAHYHTLSTQLNMDDPKKGTTKKLLKWRKRLFYKWCCDLVVCPSDKAKEDLLSQYGRLHSAVIPNPMEDRLLPVPARKHQDTVVSFLGRFHDSKGCYLLLEAFREFKKAHPDSGLVLHFAGYGPAAHEIQEQARLHADLRYFGHLPYDQIDQYLSESDFLIIPSLSDNLPTVGLEALMQGKPLLCSKETGLARYLEEAKDAFLFDPERQDLLRVLNKVAQKQYDYAAMSQAARIKFHGSFGMQRYVDQVCALIL